MRFTKTELIKPLSALNGIIEASKKQTMPILANTLVKCIDGRLQFLGSDLEIEARYTIPYQTLENESFEFTVEAGKFLSIIKSLNDDKEIHLMLSDDDEKLTVKSGSSKYNLQTLPAEDFPIITNRREIFDEDDEEEQDEEYKNLPQNREYKLSIEANQLSYLLKRVNHAMGVADMRAYLNGVYFKYIDNGIDVVATDGHRLSLVKHEFIQEDLDGFDLLLPRKAVLELLKIIPNNDSQIEITKKSNNVEFQFKNEDDEVVFVSKLIDGKFPDYNRVVPQNLEHQITINRQLLAKTISRTSVLADKRFNGVKFAFSNNSFEIVAKNSEQEEAREQIDIDLDISDSIEIGFNLKYILDVLNSLDCTDVNFVFTGQNAPGMFVVPDNYNMKFVVMPMRL